MGVDWGNERGRLIGRDGGIERVRAEERAEETRDGSDRRRATH